MGAAKCIYKADHTREGLREKCKYLQVQNAVEAGNAKAAMAKQSAVGGLSQQQVQELESVQLAAQANALAEMEQSHNASQRQLLAEMDMMRQQKAAAEERAIRADYYVMLTTPSNYACHLRAHMCGPSGIMQIINTF